MKIERTRNAGRNMFFGILLKINQIILPFLIRTVMIYYMGVNYLGLNSLFSSVLQVLNLAELGVGSAMVYSMYKPVAENDYNKICALMLLYKKYYRVIGLIIAFIGVTLTPFIPRLIQGEVPSDVNIFVLYILNLLTTVLSYWLFAYRGSVLIAYQRNDVSSKVALMTGIVQFGLQIVVIVILKNYYIYIIVALLIQILNNIITAYCAKKIYPQIRACGNLDRIEVKQINKRISDLFTSRIGAVVVNSADTIVISAFLGLKILAIYQNYYFILTAVIGITSIVFYSCTAGIGNSIILESKEKNYHDLEKFTFLISWIACFCSCCFLCVYQPFMKAWVGKELMLNMAAVITFTVYFYIYEINQLLNLYKDAAGMWHEDRFRPLVTAVANVSLNLLTVKFWGIYGVLLSTVLSMVLIGMPWLIHNLFTVVFRRDQLQGYLKRLFQYVISSLLLCGFTYLICSFIQFGSFFTIIIRFSVCFILPNMLYMLLYRKTSIYMDCMQLVNKLTKGKIFFLKRY